MTDKNLKEDLDILEKYDSVIETEVLDIDRNKFLALFVDLANKIGFSIPKYRARVDFIRLDIKEDSQLARKLQQLNRKYKKIEFFKNEMQHINCRCAQVPIQDN